MHSWIEYWVFLWKALGILSVESKSHATSLPVGVSLKNATRKNRQTSVHCWALSRVTWNCQWHPSLLEYTCQLQETAPHASTKATRQVCFQLIDSKGCVKASCIIWFHQEQLLFWTLSFCCCLQGFFPFGMIVFIKCNLVLLFQLF